MGQQGTLPHSFIMIIKSLNNLTNTYIKKNLYPLTLGNIYVSNMKDVLEKKPWVRRPNKYYAFIIKEDSLYIGWALLSLYDNSIMFYIKHSFRRKGYGTLLNKSVINFCNKRNIKNLTVKSHTKTNFNFFKKLGFIPETNKIVVENIHRFQ